ncbi:heavy-metal-associated domain-containing protein [Eggerthellaceae bacterium zg-997]|nr:heavy-metal-associated domain-containing protein [Eggerthellaceae bacterium zg-997]
MEMTPGTLAVLAILAVMLVFAMRAAVRLWTGQGGCHGGGAAVRRRRTAPADPNKDHYAYSQTFKVSDMTCQNCANAVEDAVNRLEGHLGEASLQHGRLLVLAKAPIDPAAIERQVVGAGYYVVKTR